MTFKEFLETRPEDVKKARACKTIDEFKKLAYSVGIDCKDDAELQEVYNFIHSDLLDQHLDQVAGGSARRYNAKDAYINPNTGKMMFEGSGDKI